MKYYLSILAISAMFCATAQQLSGVMPDNGVYLSDSDFMVHRLQDPFSGKGKNKLNTNRRNFLIVTKENAADTFYFGGIWGFRKNGEDWRIVAGEYYHVDFVNEKICLYDIPGTGQSEGIRPRNYFSVSGSGPVYHLSKQNLLNAYHENREFCEKIRQMPFTRSILRWDKERGNYLFVSWL